MNTHSPHPLDQGRSAGSKPRAFFARREKVSPGAAAAAARAFAAIVAIAALASLAGCGHKAAAPGAPPPPTVTVVKPLEKEVTDWREYIGRTAAVDSVEIRARVSGYLTQIAFKAGDLVKKGDLLFVIDPRPYQADLDRAQAQVAQSEAQLQLAQAEFDRAQGLRQKNVTSAEEFDNKAAALKQNQASVSSTRAALETAKLNLEFCSIHSPIEGRVSREQITLGNLVTSTNTGTDGVLTTVVSVDPLYVYADVDENAVLDFIKLVETGKVEDARSSKMPLYLGLPNETGFPHQGYLDFVNNTMDPTTGTMQIRGVFKNWNALMAPGFFVRVRFAEGTPAKALLVPDKAIGTDQNQQYVIVVKADKTAEYRPVKLGPISDGLRVVQEGLKPGELVITEGLMRVRPGTLVNPEETALAAPPPADAPKGQPAALPAAPAKS